MIKMGDIKDKENIGLLEVLEERIRDKKAKEKRDEFFSFVRGEKKPDRLITMVRGEE